jgi:hypothetical protein
MTARVSEEASACVKVSIVLVIVPLPVLGATVGKFKAF